jgi:hypothetical protein
MVDKKITASGRSCSPALPWANTATFPTGTQSWDALTLELGLGIIKPGMELKPFICTFIILTKPGLEPSSRHSHNEK